MAGQSDTTDDEPWDAGRRGVNRALERLMPSYVAAIVSNDDLLEEGG